MTDVMKTPTGTQERIADYRRNPFMLVYDGAITKNESGKVNTHPVTYKLNGLDIAANLYTPAHYSRVSCAKCGKLGADVRPDFSSLVK